jgi:hypothetical protein
MSKENNNKSMKSYFDFFNQLVEPVRTQAINNTAEKDLHTPECMSYETFAAVLRSAFVWSDTPEGGKYWMDIHDSLASGDDCLISKPSEPEIQTSTEESVAPEPTVININTINVGDTIILRDDLVNCDKYGGIMYCDILMNANKLTFKESYFLELTDGTFYCNENDYLYHTDMVKEVIPCDKLRIQEQPTQEKEAFVADKYTPSRLDYFAGMAMQGLLSAPDSEQYSIAELAGTAVCIANEMIRELNKK